jgi:urease accessory protein
VSSIRPALRVGVGGPAGAGKTTLVAELCARLRDRYELAVITNGPNAHEDAQLLLRTGALPPDRVVSLDGSSSPHDALDDDAVTNLAAVDALIARHGDLDVVLIEGGDDLGDRTFHPDLVDLVIYVIDVATGEKAARRRSSGIAESDLLVINKTDLAPAVGVSLMNLERDAISVRRDRPFVFSNLRDGQGGQAIARFVIDRGMLG